MKKCLINCFVLTIFLSSSLVAQVFEEERSMSQGMHNALRIDLPSTSYKDAQSLWKKFMKDYGAKTKKVKRKPELFTNGATIAAVNGVEKINLYSTFSQSGEDVELTVWFDLGGGTYLNSEENPGPYVGAQQLLNKFALENTKSSIRKQEDQEEKRLDRLQSDFKKLKKANKRYNREIEQAKEKIEKAEANIETNEIEQEEIQRQIEAQKAVIEVVKKKLEDL